MQSIVETHFLPLEVWEIILLNINKREDIAQLRLVCHDFFSIYENFYYHKYRTLFSRFLLDAEQWQSILLSDPQYGSWFSFPWKFAKNLKMKIFVEPFTQFNSGTTNIKIELIYMKFQWERYFKSALDFGMDTRALYKNVLEIENEIRDRMGVKVNVEFFTLTNFECDGVYIR